MWRGRAGRERGGEVTDNIVVNVSPLVKNLFPSIGLSPLASFLLVFLLLLLLLRLGCLNVALHILPARIEDIQTSDFRAWFRHRNGQPSFGGARSIT